MRRLFRFAVTLTWVSVWLFCKLYIQAEQQAGSSGDAGLFSEIKLWHLVWFDEAKAVNEHRPPLTQVSSHLQLRFPYIEPAQR